MATKIGYNPQLANTGIDWVTVGTDVANTLKLQEEAREKTRVEAKAALQKEIKDLAATELGKDAQANQWIMNGVDAITSTALIDQKLWQSGALSTKDYTRNRANRKNGTELVLQAFNTFNKDYDAVMEGINSGELSSKTLDLRAQVESLFDFGKTGIYINPNDGEVNVAKKDLVDGVYRMSDNPDEFLNASELMQAATAKFQRFKAKEEAAALAESVAQNVLRTVGGTSIEEAYLALDGDKATQKKLNDARLDQVKSILTNEKAGSFLADYLKEGYSFTRNKDEADADPKKILINQDGSTNFEDSKHGKEQYNYAVKKFDELLETYLPKKKQAPLPEKLSAKERQLRGQAESAIDNIAKLWYGNTQEIEAAASFLEGVLPSVSGIDVKENEVIVTKIDINGAVTGKKGKRYTKSYPREEFNTFIESISGELGGAVSASEAVQIATSKLPEGRTAKGGTGSFLVDKPMGLTEKFGNYIETYLTETLPLSKDEEEAQSQLEGLLKPFGNFEIEQFGFGDNIKITYPTGKTTAPLELEIDLDDADAVQQIKNFLINNISFFEEGVAIQESNINEALSGAGTTGELD